MLLDDHERRKFAAYCRQAARDAKLMQEQLAKSGMPQYVIEALVKKEKMEHIGFSIVADVLESTESMTLPATGEKGGDVDG